MSREKRSMERMFAEFKLMSSQVMVLGGVVQDSGYNPTDDELQEWIDSVNNTINRINSLKEDVVRFYQD